jgi:hypothetical protein
LKAKCSTNAGQNFAAVFSPSSRRLLADVIREIETSTNPLWSGAGATIKMADSTENNGTPPRVGTSQLFDKPEQYVTNNPNQLNRKDREKIVAKEMRAKIRARVAIERAKQIAIAKKAATRDKVSKILAFCTRDATEIGFGPIVPKFFRVESKDSAQVSTPPLSPPTRSLAHPPAHQGAP